MEAPEGFTVHLTHDRIGVIIGIAVRQGWTDEATPGELIADVVIDHTTGNFKPGEDFAQSPSLPGWVGPFLDDLGAAKQNGAVARLIESVTA